MSDVDRCIVLARIRTEHGDQRAQLAQAELPETIDPEIHAELLVKHGIDPTSLSDE